MIKVVSGIDKLLLHHIDIKYVRQKGQPSRWEHDLSVILWKDMVGSSCIHHRMCLRRGTLLISFIGKVGEGQRLYYQLDSKSVLGDQRHCLAKDFLYQAFVSAKETVVFRWTQSFTKSAHLLSYENRKVKIVK